MKKICNRCKIDLDISFFYKRTVSKDGYTMTCKSCSRESNRLTKKLYMEKYRIDNYDKIKESQKRYEVENKEKRKEYLKNNNEKVKLRRRKYQKKRCDTDPLYKLSRNIRNLIYKSCRLNSISLRTQQILGCSFKEFKLYLESKFEPWMTWENRGMYNGEFNYGWDIDHIIPISRAKTEKEVVKLNHYSNLQPLCSKVNRDIKVDK